jgi:hypothetical protein
MNIAYSQLLLRNAELLAEIEELKKQNQLLAAKLNERLSFPTPTLEEMAKSRDTAWEECEKMRQRFVQALQQR